MSEHVVFQLYGPLASWGGVAVGEVRPTEDRPTKSAVVGLVAAALGLRREQEAEILALADALRFACEVHRPGLYLRDYHTVQVPTETSWTADGAVPGAVRTRADSLALHDLQIRMASLDVEEGKRDKKSRAQRLKREGRAVQSKPNSLQSYREYRTDPYVRVALRRAGSGAPPLVEVAERLRQPRFPLYLGRKACPPALPLDPVLVQAPTFAGAFADAPHGSRLARHLIGLLGKRQASRTLQDLAPRRPDVFWEGGREDGGWPGAERAAEVQRWDRPASRTRWEFALRTEWELRNL